MSKFSIVFIGGFFLIISLLSFVNIIYSYYFNLYLNLDSYIPPLILSTILLIILITFKNKINIKVSIFNKILIVISGYIVLPTLIALPYYFSIYNISIIDIYFEAISGFT